MINDLAPSASRGDVLTYAVERVPQRIPHVTIIIAQAVPLISAWAHWSAFANTASMMPITSQDEVWRPLHHTFRYAGRSQCVCVHC